MEVSAKYGKKISELFDLVLDTIIESENEKDDLNLQDNSKKEMKEVN